MALAARREVAGRGGRGSRSSRRGRCSATRSRRSGRSKTIAELPEVVGLQRAAAAAERARRHRARSGELTEGRRAGCRHPRRPRAPPTRSGSLRAITLSRTIRCAAPARSAHSTATVVPFGAGEGGIVVDAPDDPVVGVALRVRRRRRPSTSASTNRGIGAGAGGRLERETRRATLRARGRRAGPPRSAAAPGRRAGEARPAAAPRSGSPPPGRRTPTSGSSSAAPRCAAGESRGHAQKSFQLPLTRAKLPVSSLQPGEQRSRRGRRRRRRRPR